MPNGNINAVNGISFFEIVLLIYDGIDSDSGFTGLPVANNQLTLATANGDHGINSFQACLEWFFNRLTKNNPGGFPLEWHLETFARNGSFTVKGFAQGIDNPAQNAFACHNGSNAVLAFNGVTFPYSFGKPQ